MAIELSAIAAGLPMAASFAMAGGFVALREGRRRSSLNAAMHELRRPLQALCLSLPSGAVEGRPIETSLELAVAAVERLDREINGAPAGVEGSLLSLRPVVGAAAERWRPTAARLGRSLELVWRGSDPVLRGDRIGLAQAVDNLISNALRHGSGQVTVIVGAEADALQVVVQDQGEALVAAPPRRPRMRLGGRDRHGHGLAIVRKTAAQHAGSFRLCIGTSGTEARLVLPLSEEFG